MKQLGLMILGIFCIFLLNGCSDFLEEKSQDEVIPKTVEDYNELLLNYMGYTDIWSVLYVLSDETGIGEKLLRSDTDKDDYRAVEIKGVFTWQPDMWETESVGVNSAYEDTYDDEYETPPSILAACWNLATVYEKTNRHSQKLQALEKGLNFAKEFARLDENFLPEISEFTEQIDASRHSTGQL